VRGLLLFGQAVEKLRQSDDRFGHVLTFRRVRRHGDTPEKEGNFGVKLASAWQEKEPSKVKRKFLKLTLPHPPGFRASRNAPARDSFSRAGEPESWHSFPPLP